MALGSVLLGPVIAALVGGRLSGAIWPVAATQVAQYAAVTGGMIVVLWLGRLLSGDTTGRRNRCVYWVMTLAGLFLFVDAFFQSPGERRALALFIVAYRMAASFTEDTIQRRLNLPPPSHRGRVAAYHAQGTSGRC